MRLDRYPSAAVLLAVLHLAGCTSWQPSTVSPRQVLEETQPGSVRVTTAGGRQSVIHEPAVENDSIHGIIFGQRICEPLAPGGRFRDCASPTDTVRLALDDVTMLEVKVRGVSSGKGAGGFLLFFLTLKLMCQCPWVG